LVVGLGLVGVVWRFVDRIRNLVALWRFRPGAPLNLGLGRIEIGGLGVSIGAGSAALALPNTGSEFDDTTLGTVSLTGSQQRVRDPSGKKLLVTERPVQGGRTLRSGDLLSVPKPDEVGERLWELEYVEYDPHDKTGEVEVVENPLDYSWGSAIRKVLIGLGLLWVIAWALDSEAAAALAYRIPLMDWLYAQILLPNLPA
jgi:hypothetical protein